MILMKISRGCGYVSQPTGGIGLPTIVVNLVLITIDCHHECGFEAFTNEVIFFCLKRGRVLHGRIPRSKIRYDCIFC